MKSKSLYEFGQFRLDTEKLILWSEDRIVPLKLKALETLVVLVRRGGEVVTKEELMEKVWGDSFVEENSLSRNIHELRKTLDELGGEKFIETVPKRGYRFAGEISEIENGNGQVVIERQIFEQNLIEEISDGANLSLSQYENEENLEESKKSREEKGNVRILPAASPAFRFTLPIIAIAVVSLLALAIGFAVRRYQTSQIKTPLAGVESIAVLPLQNLSENENEKTLSVGLTDALISKLGGLNRFAVRPLSATQKYKAQDTAPLNLGEELKVDAVLEGSLQTIDNRLRVNVRLLRIADGSQIWAGSFDENESDIFKLQDLLSRQVANSLIEQLTPQEQRQLVLRPTENLEAYKLYLKGRYFWNQRTVEGYFKAIDFFEQSVRFDPNFALGYSGIADCYTLLEQREGLPPEDAFHKAEQAARRALELDETLAEAHASMALVKELYRWEWVETEKHLKRAIELNPNYVTAYGSYGMHLIAVKRFDEAEAQLKKAESLDPTSRNIAIYLAWKFYFSRQYDRAIEQSRKALELDNSLTTPHMILRSAFEQKGMFDEAVESELKRLKNRDPQTLESLRDAYRKSGIKGFWQKQIEVSRKKINTDNEVPDYEIAARYALLDRNKEALSEIEKGFVNRGSRWHMIDADPAFDLLRTNSHFQDLVRKLNLPQ